MTQSTAKTSAKKTVAASASVKTAARKTPAKRAVDTSFNPEEVNRMIAEAAYYNAEKNGFMGYPMDHWIEAERAIDAMLCQSKTDHSEG